MDSKIPRNWRCPRGRKTREEKEDFRKGGPGHCYYGKKT
jgi:hypothetical protein